MGTYLSHLLFKPEFLRQHVKVHSWAPCGLRGIEMVSPQVQDDHGLQFLWPSLPTPGCHTNVLIFCANDVENREAVLTKQNSRWIVIVSPKRYKPRLAEPIFIFLVPFIDVKTPVWQNLVYMFLRDYRSLYLGLCLNSKNSN
jgi:hypothetical protein